LENNSIPINKNIIIRYGLPGFLLAFTTLPLYLSTPLIYEGKGGLTLATIGLILMLVRFSDAVTDPIIGKFIDSTKKNRFIRWLVPSLLILSIGFFLLFNPPKNITNLYLIITWLSIFLLIVSISNGAATLAYQSWIITWSEIPQDQINLVSSREFFSILGVITASFFATQNMFLEMSIVVVSFCIFCVLAIRPLRKISLPKKKRSGLIFFKAVFTSKTRGMFFIFGINAFANSIPALLFIFFVKDILLLESRVAGFLLITYFLFAIGSIPIWSKLIKRLGPNLVWINAILLSVLGFIWALFLGPGNFLFFLLICIVTGFALGAELLCPPLILANKINQLKQNGLLEGSFFGVFNLFLKLSLALSSGTILPIISYFGYTSSGSPSAFSLSLMQFLYAGLPCFLKLVCLVCIIKFLYQPKGKK